MIINLNKTYYIDVDPLNHTLKERYTSKNGEPRSKTLGYYGNLEQALNGYIKRRQIDEGNSKEMDLEGYISHINGLNAMAVKELKELLKGNGSND